MMNTFILQGGHPLLSLQDDTLRQQPFALGPVPPGTTSSIGTSWKVPVAVRALSGSGPARAPRPATSSSTTRTHLLPEAGQGLAVINAGGWGVFRVGYETAHRLALAEHLPELTAIERAEFISDTWATTLAGHSGLREFLLWLHTSGLEPDPVPWMSVVGRPALE